MPSPPPCRQEWPRPRRRKTMAQAVNPTRRRTTSLSRALASRVAVKSAGTVETVTACAHQRVVRHAPDRPECVRAKTSERRAATNRRATPCRAWYLPEPMQLASRSTQMPSVCHWQAPWLVANRCHDPAVVGRWDAWDRQACSSRPPRGLPPRGRRVTCAVDVGTVARPASCFARTAAASICLPRASRDITVPAGTPTMVSISR